MNRSLKVALPATSGADVRGLSVGLVSARFYETWDFYTEQLGFRTLCEWDTYVHLRHPCGVEVGVLRQEVDSALPELVSATDGRGFWFNLEVTDADAEFARLSSAGVTVVEPPTDKPWGDRQFVVRDPNGVLVLISHRLDREVDAPSALAVAS